MSKDKYKAGMAVRREVLGDAHVDRAISGATDFTKPLQDMVTENCRSLCLAITRMPPIAGGECLRICAVCTMDLSAIITFLPTLDNLFCRPESLDTSRHATINRRLKQNFLNFLYRTAVTQGPQNMSL